MPAVGDKFMLNQAVPDAWAVTLHIHCGHVASMSRLYLCAMVAGLKMYRPAVINAFHKP